MKAVKLQTEYLVNPLGLGILHPTLHWIAEGGKKQTAFRLQASINGAPSLDTDFVPSSSMRFSFPLPLSSCDRVEWKVTLLDENGVAGEESESASFEMGLLAKSDFKASWIRGDYKVSKKKRYPVDIFRKVFLLDDCVSARLYISALGVYEAYINGRRVGQAVLTPGSTDPRVRVQVDTFDVGDYLRKGKNEIILLLADGWYRGSIGAKGFTYVFGKENGIFAQLEIVPSSGEAVSVYTDSSWSWCNDGPIRFADLKDGEIVDNRLTPTFGGKAVLTRYDGAMTPSNSTFVKEISSSAPCRIIPTKNGKTTLVYPSNVAGYLAFEVEAKGGEKIHIVMGEMLNEEEEVTLHNVQCVRKGKKTPLQEITFICKKGHNEYKSRFFYGGFGFATIESEADIDYSSIRQIAISTEMEETSSFECSNPLINIFYRNTLASLKSNSVDIPTDCPTRERMGWTGDSQIIFNTASYLFGYGAFARKHLRDVYDRQDKNGRLPQIAPYSAEDWFMGVMNGSVGWADAGVLIPYRMYLKYGDIDILKEHYEGMMRYARFMISRCGRAKGLYSLYAKPLHLSKQNKKYGVNTGQSYGEWAEPSDVKAFAWTDFAMPHPEESMAYTSYILSLMAKISSLVGKEENIPLLEEYAEGVKKAYQELVTKKGHSLDTNRQAKLVRPLYMKLLSPEQEEYAKKRLIEALSSYSWRLGTGFLSTPFILDVLSSIDVEYAYRLLENEEMPGWLYMASHDTGTIWEGWEGLSSQAGIASLNHYSKGAMVEWLFHSMLGIQIDGENHVVLKPLVGGHVEYAKGHYDSIYGRISSCWKKLDGKVIYEFAIPSNVTATLILNGASHELGAGSYTFEVDSRKLHA